MKTFAHSWNILVALIPNRKIKKCMYEEDVAVNVLTKPFFSGLDIPDVKLFRILLRLRTKEEVMRLKLCMIAEQDRG